jgi:hypothetical protein
MPIDRNDPEYIAAVEEETSGLKSKIETLLKEVKVFKAKAKGADIDPEEHAKLIAEKEDLENRLKSSETKSKSDIEKLTKSVSEKDASISKMIVDSEMSNAIAKAGIAGHYADAVNAMTRPLVNVAFADGKHSVSVDGKPLGEYLAAWAASDAGKHFVSAQKNSGGGAAGNKSSSSNGALKRSSMTPVEKREFIEKNGQDAYLKLPKE